MTVADSSSLKCPPAAGLLITTYLLGAGELITLPVKDRVAQV